MSDSCSASNADSNRVLSRIFILGGKALVRGVRWDCSIATVR